MAHTLDPNDIAITRDSQRLALADFVNTTLAYRSAEVEVIRNQLRALLAPQPECYECPYGRSHIAGPCSACTDS